MSGNPRGLLLLLGGVLIALVPGRGVASPPVPGALSPRELLALSPKVVSELGPPAKATARARLAQALSEQAAASLPPMVLPIDARLAPAVQLPLTPGLQKVLALDLQRRARKQEPVLVAVLLSTALKPLPAPGLLDAPEAAGERSARLLLPAGLLPSAAASLRRVCERAAAQWPTLLEGATVRLVAGVPFAVLLSQPERVVYVNPVVLALLAPPVSPGDAAGAAGALAMDGERLLTYRSIADCAQKVRAGCQACLRGDAAECAAVKATLTHAECRDLDTPRVNLPDLCSERALSLRSVADCVARRAPACSPTPRAADCREAIDRCIANPAAGSHGPNGRRPADDPPPGLACAACTTCGQGCAATCGECSRQASEPLGEPCSNKLGQTCTESCNDWNRDCTQGCGASRQSERDDNSGGSFGSLCTSCSRSCSQSCSQCNGSCSQCSSDCNQCNSDCNQCNSSCASCSSQCNQCSGDCASCGNQCNHLSCPNQQCSVSELGGRYPRFPLPPGPADPPPPLARLLVGARGTLAFVLPPLLFLWWRRRLYAARRPTARAR